MSNSKKEQIASDLKEIAKKYNLNILNVDYRVSKNKKLTEWDINFLRYGFIEINTFYKNRKYAKVIGINKYEFEIAPDNIINYKVVDVLYNVDSDSLLNLEFYSIDKFEKFLKDREIIDKDFSIQEKFVFNPVEYGFTGVAFFVRNVVGKQHCFYKIDDKWKYTQQDMRCNYFDTEIEDLTFNSPQEVDEFLIKQRIYYRRVKVK